MNNIYRGFRVYEKKKTITAGITISRVRAVLLGWYKRKNYITSENAPSINQNLKFLGYLFLASFYVYKTMFFMIQSFQV